MQIQGEHNSVSIALFQGAANFLELGYWGQPWGQNIRRVPQFTKQLDGKRNTLFGEGRAYGAAQSAETLFLKIERRTDQYSGSYAFVEIRPPDSVDDIRWTKIGTQSWIDFKGKLPLWADNNESQDAPETPAYFYMVLIRKI